FVGAISSLVRIQPRAAARSWPFATALGVLTFAVSCGSNSSNSSESTGPIFSNGSLSGHYTYTLAGSSTSGNVPYQESGTFVADGNGNITGGVDDFVQNSTLSSSHLAGSYKIADDDTGMITLKAARGTVQFAIALISSSSFYLIEFDSFASGDGEAVQQNSSALSTTPSGTFIFRLHYSLANRAALGSASSVGQMTVQNRSISGTEDIVRAGVTGSHTITGSMTEPSADGRGTAIITDDTGTQSSYAYYVVDPSTLMLLETDPGPLGGGRADQQSAVAF